jgi:Amt family ammonium transporter
MIGVEMLDKLKIDDVVGAVSVHGFAGVWGVLSVGLFATQQGVLDHTGVESDTYGLLLGGGAEQLGIQALGAGAIIAWTCVTSGIMFLAIKYTVGLRVSEDEELRGLDIDEHGIEAYPGFERAPESGMAYLGEAATPGSATSVVDAPASST